MKIGVFDSGFGGLHIFRHIIKKMPEYDFVYLGDTARTPYGSRSQSTIYKYTEQAVDFLFKNNCELIVIACNTASAEALRKIQKEYLPKKYPNKRVLGVITPTVEEAVVRTKNKKVGVIGTESTIDSRAFETEIHKIDKSVRVFGQACPLFVPIVESGEKDKKILDSVSQKYLKKITSKNIDVLILGCTHYGIIKNQIEKTLKNLKSRAVVLSEGEIVSKKLLNYLNRHPEIDSKLTKNKTRLYFTTDLTDKFQKLGSKFVGQKISATCAQFIN